MWQGERHSTGRARSAGGPCIGLSGPGSPQAEPSRMHVECYREGPERRRALHRPSGPESPQAEPSQMHVECYREDPEGLS